MNLIVSNADTKLRIIAVFGCQTNIYILVYVSTQPFYY